MRIKITPNDQSLIGMKLQIGNLQDPQVVTGIDDAYMTVTSRTHGEQRMPITFQEYELWWRWRILDDECSLCLAPLVEVCAIYEGEANHIVCPLCQTIRVNRIREMLAMGYSKKENT